MAEDTMFQDAVDVLKQGDKARAKDILTPLLKTDQNNVTYWIWMSASVETARERIYCLQTALKLEPENGIAKRGLILLGARRPVQPAGDMEMDFNNPASTKAWVNGYTASYGSNSLYLYDVGSAPTPTSIPTPTKKP